MPINYEDYKRLIFKLAHTYSSLTGIEFDELVSAGNEKFVTCQKTYDPKKAKFSTYLTWELRGLFREMQRKQKRLQMNTVHDLELTNSPMQEELVFFVDILKGLSSDAKEVVKIVFDTPTDLIEMLPKKQPRGISKHQIQKHLRHRGWSFSRIWKSFGEITESLI
jgi:RNA polymerase sigma factor (sigma-70 family)